MTDQQQEQAADHIRETMKVIRHNEYETKVAETLMAWLHLPDFGEMVNHVAASTIKNEMPSLINWADLTDYVDLVTVVNDFLQNQIDNELA